MFSYVFMKILERRPKSYDRLMDKADRGQIRAAKERVCGLVPKDAGVLEIGCGTGELASMIIGAGSVVDGFDVSPSMLGAARERIIKEGLGGKFTLRRMGVDGMDEFPDKAYDVVVSTLVFSEFTDDERRYALFHSQRVLKPGGMLIIADEVKPDVRALRVLHNAIRTPMVLVTYLISSSSTKPLENIREEIEGAGFMVEMEEKSHARAFVIIKGVKK